MWVPLSPSPPTGGWVGGPRLLETGVYINGMANALEKVKMQNSGYKTRGQFFNMIASAELFLRSHLACERKIINILEKLKCHFGIYYGTAVLE